MRSIRTRKVLAIVMAVVLLAAIGAFLIPNAPSLPISQKVYDRLRLGMTDREVAAVVQCPPGDYSHAYSYATTRPVCEGGLPIYIDYRNQADGSVSAIHPTTGRPLRGKWWRGKEGLLHVYFGDDGRVIERRYYPGYPRNWFQYHYDRLW
jgi:hypothetical protein